MDYSSQIELVENFLSEKKLGFVKPGEVIDLKNGMIEVVFLKPEGLDPNVAVVDPPDERVLINIQTNEVSLVIQM